MVGRIGAGEVADQTADARRREMVVPLLELSAGQAKTVEPSIEMDDCGGGTRKVLPSFELTGLVEHRNQPRGDELACAARQGAVEDGDLRRRAEHPAQRGPLV